MTQHMSKRLPRQHFENLRSLQVSFRGMHSNRISCLVLLVHRGHFCRHRKTAQAGQLESALLERNKECATLRRERNEAQQKLQDESGYLGAVL